MGIWTVAKNFQQKDRPEKDRPGRDRSSSLIFFSAALLSTVVGCGKSESLKNLIASFSSTLPVSSVKVNFCTEPSYDQKQYLKTVIILDHSGSNKQNYRMAQGGNGAPAVANGTLEVGPQLATDPLGVTRYGNVNTPGTLLNYLSTLAPNDPADPRNFFALVNFSDAAETYPVDSSGFTSDTNAFFNQVLADSGSSGTTGPNDNGSTSYLSALNAAYTIINRDIQSAKACEALPLGSTSPGSWCPNPGVQTASSYVVVFMSDGSPIINLSGIGVAPNGDIVVDGEIVIEKEPLDEILGKTATIAGLVSDAKHVTSVNFFTIYYYFPGNVDESGRDLLAKMAKAGNGVAYNALSGSNIDYTRFKPPQKRIRFSLADVLVTNASATWWVDGQYHADTDLDGLPDDIEVSWGSDPHLKSTDRNGVNDLVKYRATSARVCLNKNAMGLCTDPATNYADGLCRGISRQTINGQLQFNSTDPNGLNDCEKLILNNSGGLDNPDSNGDLISDWLEFKNNVPFQLGTAPAINTPDQDGFTIYQKIKFTLPLAVPFQQTRSVSPTKYNLQLVQSTLDQDCYSLNVDNLQTIGDANMVRVDLIMKSDLLRETYQYRMAEKRFSPGSSSMIINSWTDANEILAGTWRSWQ